MKLKLLDNTYFFILKVCTKFQPNQIKFYYLFFLKGEKVKKSSYKMSEYRRMENQLGFSGWRIFVSITMTNNALYSVFVVVLGELFFHSEPPCYLPMAYLASCWR